MESQHVEYEDMEILDSSQEGNEGNEQLASGFEIDPLRYATGADDLADDAVWIDFFIEAHEREFKGQKKEKPLDMLHVQASTKNNFEQQVWMMYSPVLRREILYQRAEEGQDELLMWSPTKPTWADRDRFFLLHHKRNSCRLSDLTDEILAGFQGMKIKLSVLVYSVSLVSSKDYDRAKVVLGLGSRSSGLRDRAGADSNQSVLQLVNELKQRNKHRFVKPMDASFTLWANYIQGSAAHLRTDLLEGQPPEHLKELFISVDNSGAQAQLEDSYEGATVAEAVNETVETELKDIQNAFIKVQSSVVELGQKIEQLQMSIKGRKTLISAFKNSLKINETDESRSIAEGIIDCPDVDHD